ncbi:hypothetical protein COB57_00695 [Candidatus Peregrinibacteria bacterium]|nr:MAG: hypothetical protein COB57_00695 [Candidatus Peregrinibacteria bacterium]
MPALNKLPHTDSTPENINKKTIRNIADSMNFRLKKIASITPERERSREFLRNLRNGVHPNEVSNGIIRTINNLYQFKLSTNDEYRAFATDMAKVLGKSIFNFFNNEAEKQQELIKQQFSKKKNKKKNKSTESTKMTGKELLSIRIQSLLEKSETKVFPKAFQAMDTLLDNIIFDTNHIKTEEKKREIENSKDTTEMSFLYAIFNERETENRDIFLATLLKNISENKESMSPSILGRLSAQGFSLGTTQSSHKPLMQHIQDLQKYTDTGREILRSHIVSLCCEFMNNEILKISIAIDEGTPLEEHRWKSFLSIFYWTSITLGKKSADILADIFDSIEDGLSQSMSKENRDFLSQIYTLIGKDFSPIHTYENGEILRSYQTKKSYEQKEKARQLSEWDIANELNLQLRNKGFKVDIELNSYENGFEQDMIIHPYSLYVEIDSHYHDKGNHALRDQIHDEFMESEKNISTIRWRREEGIHVLIKKVSDYINANPLKTIEE